MRLAVLQQALRVRREVVEAARHELLRNLDTEAQIVAGERDAIDTIQRESLAATCLAAADSAVEAFAAWLPQGRLRLKDAREARRHAEAAVNVARAGLAAARAAEAAVQSVLDLRLNARRLECIRIDQRMLDEAGQRTRSGA